MSSQMLFTAAERERIGVLVNNMSVLAAEILSGGGRGFSRRALSNLANLKKDHEDLLKRLDGYAREQGDESPLRLIEDLPRMPSDVAQMLTVVRRCLSASAFLGHCIAQPTNAQIDADALGEEKRLH